MGWAIHHTGTAMPALVRVLYKWRMVGFFLGAKHIEGAQLNTMVAVGTFGGIDNWWHSNQLLLVLILPVEGNGIVFLLNNKVFTV